MSWRDEIEQAANGSQRIDDAALVSIAISLKRIADTIEGGPDRLPPTEYLAECIANAIRQGLQR